jgi:pilus assembly protein CpaE
MEVPLLNLSARDTLRVLLVAERDQLRDEVGAVLADWAGDHRLYWVAQPELAVTRAQDVLPHVILVDDELSGLNLSAVIKQLLAHAPGAAILVLLKQDAMGEARQAVLAGARGFVTKPLAGDEFWATVHQVLAQRPSSSREESSATRGGNVLVFIGPKGGTGRTTVTVNTAIHLRRLTNKPLVLVDADFASPALDVVLNLHDDHDLTDLLSRISQLDPELIERVLAHHASGLRVLLAPPPASLNEPVSLPQVQQVLAHLKRMFGWVVVDLGLPLDETAFAFLDSADRIVMTVLPEMVGLRNTRLMLDQLHGRGYPDDKVWLVLNRATIRGGISQRDIENRLRVRVRHTVPDDQPLVSHSVNRGVPLVMSHERSAVGRAIRTLAQLLAQDAGAVRSPNGKPAPAPAEGLQRWFRRTRAVNT